MSIVIPLKDNTNNSNSLNYNNIKFKQMNYPNHLKKLTNTQISNSNNKSLVNNNSLLSTKLNSSESFLFKSIYINNTMKLFKLKNLSIKNQFYTATNSDVNKNVFKKFIKKKFSESFKKIKVKDFLPKMENIHSFSNSASNIKPNTNTGNQIQKISFFDRLFRKELYDIHNYNNNSSGINDHRNYFCFKESTKNRALIRNCIYQKEKKYRKDLEDKNKHKIEVNKNLKKIKYIYKDVTMNKINIEIDYNTFLKEKIQSMKDQDFELYKYIEILLKQIKDLFIQIKIKSDRLWHLFDIRNFFICVKEETSIKNLPLIFRCYNSDYLDELTKISEADFHSLEQKNKKKNNLNFFHIPNNLLIYIKSLNDLDNGEIESKYQKYLDPNYIIFNSPEDFIKTYKLVEKKILDNLKKSLVQKTLSEKMKLKLISIINDLENEDKSFTGDYNNIKDYCSEIKINNDIMKKRKLRLSVSTGNLKLKRNNLGALLNLKDESVLKNIEEKKDESFLKLIRRNHDVEKNQFLYRYYQLQKIKNFNTKKEYVYYYIIKNNIKFFETCPEYYYNQEIFDLKKFNDYIDNIRNLEQYSESFITSNILYLLNIYENAINSFLYSYYDTKRKYMKTDKYYTVRKKEINEKKNYLFEKQRLLDFKIKEMKIKKYNRKYTKYRYIQRNSYLNSSLTNIHSKGKSFELKTNNKKDKDEYCMLNY